MLTSNRFRPYLLSIALLGFFSSALAESESLEVKVNNSEQSFANNTLTLDNDATECKLSIKNDDQETQLALALSTPCYWVTRPDSTVAQHYAYPENNISHILLIAGTALDWDNEKKEYHKLPLDTYCSQYLQGVSIIDGVVSVSETTMDAPNCVNQTIDEKVFHGVALAQTAKEEETPEEEEGLIENIKKTFKQLFQSES